MISAMNIHQRLQVVLLTTALLLTACHKNDDDTTYSDDCYISGFTLGALRRAMTVTTSAGTDSTYYLAYSGTTYPMVIDQVNNRITNATPLLQNTQLDHVLVTLSFTGACVHAPANDTTTWVNYASTDTIDFTTPRIYRVFSTDGTSRRDYTVSLTVRTEDPEAYTWNVRDDSWPEVDLNVISFPDIDDEITDAYDIIDMVAYFQRNGNQRFLLACREKGAATEEPLTMWSLLRDEGETWTRFDLSPDNHYGLVAATQPHIVAYDNRLIAFVEGERTVCVSRDNGITWKPDANLTIPDSISVADADGSPLRISAFTFGEHIWISFGDQRYAVRRNGYGEED